jgi:ADP-heptose:LPS heptosyltransferase
MSTHLDLSSILKIAVLRANGLGDFLFATPALRALAAAAPRAQITYLAQPWLAPFIAGRYSYVHRVLSVPPYPGIRAVDGDPEQARAVADRFFRDCQDEGYDLAIQMHGGGVQSNPFVRRLGAKQTLGLAGREVAPLDQSLRYVFYQSEILRYLELVGQLGVAPAGLAMDAPERPGDLANLRRAWPDRPAGQYVVVHCGASDPRRRWPIARFAAVADYVQRQYGLPVVATGASAERALVKDLADSAALPIVDLAGQLELGGVAALLRRARLVVSNDTGISNLAFAVRAPSIVIYWCGNLITAGPFERATFRPVLSWTLDCPACGQRACRCPVSFVQDAPLDEVLGQVDDLLAPSIDLAA